jgi:galactokinase
LAALCTRAENDFVGMPCGVMDQLVAMEGRDGHALLIDTRTLSLSYVPLTLGGACILVLNTGAPHVLAAGRYAVRRGQCESAAASLGVALLRDAELDQVGRLDDPVLRGRARHVVTENARVLEAVEAMRAGRLADLGSLLSASHASLRDDFEVSTDRLDAAVLACLKAGALGARLIGGGFGGCAIALVDVDRAAQVAAAVAEGLGDPGLAWFIATPSGGATQLRPAKRG